MSALGILVLALVGILFATCAIKMVPIHMEYLSVKRSIEAAVEEAETNAETPREIKAKLAKKFEINRIESLKSNAVKVSLKDGKTLIDARYEARVPLLLNVDVVMKFDDLEYEFSSRKR
jgi:hypothetical protein